MSDEQDFPAENIKPADSYLIKDLEKLKAISDPLRIKILECLVEGSRTVKEIARAIEVPASKLYYHINQLEEFGFIRVAGTRMISNILEKQYMVTACNFQVDKSLLSLLNDSEEQNLDSFLSPIFDTTREEIKRSLKAGLVKLEGEPDEPHSAKLMLSRSINKIPPQRVAEFQQRLNALVNELEDTDKESEGQVYAVMVIMYPIYRPSEDDSDQPAK